MRRRSTLLIILLVFSAKVFADTGGPDAFGYRWKDNTEADGPVYNWIDITTFPSATEVKLLGDDNSRGPFTLGFNFHYYWYDVNQFWVGSNGYILFQDGQIASLSFGTFPTFPYAPLPNDVIGAFMNDLTFLNPNNPGKCWYYLNSTHDTLIVSWIDVPFFDTNGNGYSGSNTFQIILSAVDSSITYQYNSVGNSSTFSGQSSVGIENYSAVSGFGLQYPSPNFLQTPPSYSAIKFYYPHPPLITDVTDAAMLQNDNEATGGVFALINSAPHTLTTKVRNYSMHTVNPFNILGQVVSQNGNTEVLESHYTDTLLQGEAEDLTFTAQFSPTAKGHYKFVTYSQLSGDAISGNNSKTQEIVTMDSTENEMWLGYDSLAQANGGTVPINWVGGSGGVGNYYVPPFYPVAVTKLHYYLYAYGAFSARMFDDDGVLGLPFTLLDSEYVSSPNINGWTTIDLPAPVIIDSGGFYLSWDETLSGSLACNVVTGHPSNRSFELFQNIWGIFRFRADQNPLIAASIEKYSIPTGVKNPDNKCVSLSVFPNPASEKVTMLYNIADARAQNALLITDMRGKLIQAISLGSGGGSHQRNFDISNLPSGIYFVVLKSGKENSVQKLVITE